MASGVGKSEHWAAAPIPDGKTSLDRVLPGGEARLRALHERPVERRILLAVVDQPAAIGVLAVVIAQASRHAPHPARHPASH